MSDIDDDKINKLIHRIGLEFQMRDADIRSVVNCPYKFTRETISNLSLEGIESEKDFDKLRTNFIYVYIGKLYTSYPIYKKIQKQSINLTKKWENRD